MPDPSEPRLDTQCVRPQPLPDSSTRPLVPPLELSVVYQFRDLDHVDAVYAGTEPGFVYARDGHPNAVRLANQIARLEAMQACIVTSSGMSAESALMLGLLKQGDHVALAQGLYGRTQVLVARELARFGVISTFFDPVDPLTWPAAITPQTRLAFVETISNPLVRVPDISSLADLCHQHGAQLAVDNTFAPVICRPADFGADFVTHSLTKMISGHSDTTIGALLGPLDDIQQIRPVASTFGLTSNPFECALTMRGMATLPLRMQRSCENALHISHFLQSFQAIACVHYPGLTSHPDHQTANRILKQGFGTIATIDLGSRAAANRFISRLNSRIPFAPSLGDVATTLSHPVTTSHRGLTESERASLGITPGLVRLSFGIEDPADLQADFTFALA